MSDDRRNPNHPRHRELLLACCPHHDQLTREVSVSIREDGKIAVGVYMIAPGSVLDGSRISGTVFLRWENVLGLIARITSEGYTFRIFVRSDVHPSTLDKE